MVLPISGKISHGDIRGEFGGTGAVGLSNYYGAAAGIPASGTIKESDFYGKSAAPPVNGNNLKFGDSTLKDHWYPNNLLEWGSTNDIVGIKGYTEPVSSGVFLRPEEYWNVPSGTYPYSDYQTSNDAHPYIYMRITSLYEALKGKNATSFTVNKFIIKINWFGSRNVFMDNAKGGGIAITARFFDRSRVPNLDNGFTFGIHNGDMGILYYKMYDWSTQYENVGGKENTPKEGPDARKTTTFDIKAQTDNTCKVYFPVTGYVTGATMNQEWYMQGCPIQISHDCSPQGATASRLVRIYDLSYDLDITIN